MSHVDHVVYKCVQFVCSLNEGSDTTKIAYEIWKSIKSGMDLFISYLICRFFHVIFDFLLDLSIPCDFLFLT